MKLHAALLEQAKKILEDRQEIDAAYLHGSAAKGSMHPNSDIDIALLLVPGKTLSLLERLNCASRMESILGRTVDLGLLSTRNLVYAKEVIDHGTELFSKNRFRTDLALTTCLSMYVELQEQRREVLYAYSA